jgi:hypothetical protein
MSHFEYISVGFSFIFALVIGRLIAVVPHAIDPSRRYWVHLAWVVQVFLAAAAAWWNLWARSSEALTPTMFLALLSYPTFLFLRAALIVPDMPGAVRSWEEHFFEKRVSFFAVTAIAPINILFTTVLVFHDPLTLRFHGPMAVAAAIGLIGCLSSNRALHGALALVSLSGGLMWFLRTPIGSP